MASVTYINKALVGIIFLLKGVSIW